MKSLENNGEADVSNQFAKSRNKGPFESNYLQMRPANTQKNTNRTSSQD